MSEDTKEIIKIVFYSIIFVLAICIVVGGLSLYANKITCTKKYSAFENRWGVMEGCQLNINGKWIPSDAYYVKEDISK